ncbi:MAG: type IV secretion system protein VirJ [Alphaproteobacteria bacterium]|nr:type IV secretion system protein VirJ [Alphaproteobacteria bacterium]
MKLLLALLVLVASIAAFLGFVGYFGGPVYTAFSPRTRPPATMRGVGAVLFSGDLGLRVGMGRDVGKQLVRNGVPLLTVNSLTFFRRRRSPDENRALIRASVQRALAMPGVERVALIGQSFGADVLQAGLAALPAALRSRVMFVALIVPGDTFQYRASPSALFNGGEPSVPAMPTARELDWVPVLCVHGREERNSLCPLLPQANVRRVAVPGGHPMRRDSRLVFSILWKSLTDASLGGDGQPSPLSTARS